MSESVEMVKDDSEDAAHEDYLTLEHFKMLANEGRGKLRYIGTTLAFLHYHEKVLTISYGLILSMHSTAHGMQYDILTRAGKTVSNVNHTHTTVI